MFFGLAIELIERTVANLVPSLASALAVSVSNTPGYQLCLRAGEVCSESVGV